MPGWGGEFQTCLDGVRNVKLALVGCKIFVKSFQGNTCVFSMYGNV